MRRRPRVHFPGALYHVIRRGNQRQKICKDDVDYRLFETLLGEVIQRHSLVLYAYVLMPNHFHLLLAVRREVGGIGLTQAAKYLRRDPSTMSLTLKRLEDGFATDSDQRKRVEHLCARLRQGRRRKYQISKG